MGFPKTADKYRQFVLLVGKLSPRQLHMAHALVCKPIGDAPTRAWFSGFAASASECDCIRARRLARRKLTMARKTMGSASIWVTLTCGQAVAEPVFYFCHQESVIRNSLWSSSRSTCAQSPESFP